MSIKTKSQYELFQEALARCTKTVWLVAPVGEQFDLKSARDSEKGMDLIRRDQSGQLEIFTSSYADEMVMLDLFGRLAA